MCRARGLRGIRCRAATHRSPDYQPENSRTLRFKEFQSPLHECFVILEDASVSGVLIKYEFGIREATLQVDGIAAGHHLIAIAVRHQHRVLDARQIGRRLTPPVMDSLKLGNESD